MSELKKYDLYDGQICRDQDGEYYCVDEADAKIAAMQKRIDELELGLQDAKVFSEWVEILGRTECEIYKSELKAMADLSLERIGVLLDD